MNWAGCRLASRFASYWHGARDFAGATLCGLPLAGLAEHLVSGAMTECPRCSAAAR